MPRPFMKWRTSTTAVKSPVSRGRPMGRLSPPRHPMGRHGFFGSAVGNRRPAMGTASDLYVAVNKPEGDAVISLGNKAFRITCIMTLMAFVAAENAENKALRVEQVRQAVEALPTEFKPPKRY